MAGDRHPRPPMPALALVLALWAALPLGAQGYERAVPTATGEISIDAVLDEPAWASAAIIEDFLQVEPVEGGAPSERTRLRLLVDADHLYIAIECFDREPDRILGNVITRDGVLDPDDRVEIIVDTFFDRRNAYWFQIGPAGGNGDALIEDNGGRFIKEWDGIWAGRSRIHEEGWTAEIALPAKTLGMAASRERFGFNARRYIKRRNEILEWAFPDRTKSLYQIAHAGTLTGMQPLDPGLGIDFKPYATLTWAREGRGGDQDFDAEAGFDLSYRITTELQATLTVNTDFAETEVDERIVNLTRFPVFFPEQRDFFLQDAGIFGFGGLRQSPLPFFSRRIGLSRAGQKVPLLAGLKLTGRVEDLSLGVLATWMDEQGGVDQKALGVARAKLNVLEQSQVGFITTFGDPGTNGDNGVFGVDFRYRTDDFLGDQALTVDAFAQISADDPAAGSRDEDALGHAYGLSINYPNDVWIWQASIWEIGEDFRPDLGFVGRPGTRQVFGNLEWRPRPGGDVIRRYEFGLETNFFWSLPGRDIESFGQDLKLFGILFESGDRFDVTLESDFERLFEPFGIADGVTIGQGDFWFQRGVLAVASSDKRALSGGLDLSYGGFFTGTRGTVGANVALRPAAGVRLEQRFEYNDIELDEGHFTTRLASFRVVWDFDPDLSWSTLAQWDDVSDNLGIQSRVRWIIEPGDDLYIVVQQGVITADADDRLSFRDGGTEVSVKLGLTFRF